MPAVIDKAKVTLTGLRHRFSVVDHAIRMNKHYGRVRGGALAGAVTYFGFLSFFPLLALSFAAVGYVSVAYPSAQADITSAVTDAFPGLVGTGNNQIQLQTFIDHKRSVGIFGLLGLLVAGLGWLDAMREALRQVFGLAPSKGNIVVKKLIDIVVLALLGTVVLLSAAISSMTTLATDWLLGVLGLEGSIVALVVLRALSITLALGVNTLLLLIFFTRLPSHRLPWRNTINGAVLGAVGVEVLKQLATVLLKSTTDNPLYASFAVVVGLLVWINFLSRVMLYAASWAATGPATTVQEQTVAQADLLDEQEADAVSGKAMPAAGRALAEVRAGGELQQHEPSRRHRAAALAGVVGLVALRRPGKSHRVSGR